MGYNTTVVVHNDSLGSIEKDPEFGKNLAKAVLRLSVTERGKMVDVRAVNHCNAAEVIETHHADHQVLVMVGGNMGQEFGYAGSWRLDAKKPEDRLTVLRNLADAEGYTLRKKPARKQP